MKKIVDGNIAASRTAYLFSEICSIYPITPSSPMASNIDYLSNTDLKNLFNDKPRVIEMQSEAGAAGAFHGALLSGSLASTYTASQGLLLMIPNMYKIAGECLPGVIHVAARTIATHALSIFGDHSDIYAVRNTGFCMLASSSVKDAAYLAAVAHLASIKGSLPFVHFFDGFRTSHEINTIDEMSDNKLLELIDFEAINDFKNRALNGENKVQYGMAENEDIYFQSVEARNELYLKMPDIVNYYMGKINELANTNYEPFNYYGSKIAENIIIAMGSITDTIKLVVDDLNKFGANVGVVTVHLYRPFSQKYLLNVLPKTIKNIAVLDRTKESGSIGEPLYLDVLSALKDTDINIVGGRFGLSSKNTSPKDIKAVFDMLFREPKNNFTIGIVDDVTHLSLETSDSYKISLPAQEIKIYGFGSDGMVSASKELLKILGHEKDKCVQGYFEYDSKKSGGVTVSNLRISDTEINAPYYVTNPSLVVVTKDEYFHKYDMLEDLEDNGILLINTIRNEKELNDFLPSKVKKIILEKHLKVYYINASLLVAKNNLKGKINKIIEFIILKLLGIDNALELLENLIKEVFVTKGEEVINNNINALKQSLDNLKVIENLTVNDELLEREENIFEKINHREGGKLTVKDLLPFRSGAFPQGLSKTEKRGVAEFVPIWNREKCIECNQCSFVCPHAVIRPLLLDEYGKDSITLRQKKFFLAISEKDCTSCGLCINTCPTNALTFGEDDKENEEVCEKYFNSQNVPTNLSKFTVKGSQFNQSKFSFSGACGGCGETPYIKLITQLFGDELVIANATGCSSIYGGSVPSTPYDVSWANSLFEDNAEFALGIYQTYKLKRERIKTIMMESIDSVTDEVKKLYEKWLDNINNYEVTKEVMDKIKDLEIPKELKELLPYIPYHTVLAIGGDGWAYDIGFGGIDHVLSSGENVKMLVLDSEVYSNTGGQASKSSKIGAVAEFADFGKKTRKKDLFRIAMSYPNCYVASVSMGANFMHTIKVFKEAMEHDGPAIIIAYSPCVEHGITGGMSNSMKESDLAVKVGYSLLMRYLPKDDTLLVDSKEPEFDRYDEFLNNEVRFKALKIKSPELAQDLLERQKENAIERYNYYKNLMK